MTELLIHFLILSLIFLTIVLFFVRRYISVILIYASFGTILSGIFFIMNAPDVAAVQMTIGSAFLIFVYIIAVKTRSKIKIGYIETPYLIYNEGNKLLGFEKEILDKFSEDSFFDIEYHPIKKEDFNTFLNSKKYDVLVGGILIGDISKCEFICSEEYLPTKIFKCKEKIPETSNRMMLYFDLPENLIDYLRLKDYLRKKSDIIAEEYLNSGYRVVFTKNNKALKDEFNRFLKRFINTKEYEDIIRRNIG